jgi:hypothetical protein
MKIFYEEIGGENYQKNLRPSETREGLEDKKQSGN